TALIARKAGRQDQAATANAAEQPHRPFDEELIQIAVPVSLQRVGAGSFCEGGQAGSLQAFAAEHLPGRVSKDHIEPATGERRAALVIEDFWKLRGPVEGSFLRGH